jgi:digeranylgeranylglycerophospholipid reductase
MRDVLIIGGGPGGLATARQLATRGFDVGLFEEHSSIGDPVHCTGVLAVEAFAELALPHDIILNPLHTARFYSPSGRSISHTTPDAEAVAIDRLALDRTLFAAARAAGVTLEIGRRVTDLQVDDHGVLVTLGDGTSERARACVLACGAQYAVQRRLGMGLPSVFLQSAQLELPASRAGDVEVHFGRRVAPGGFAWAVPVQRPGRSCARVGLMCDRDAGAHFRSFVASITKRWGLELPADTQPRQKVLPLAPIARSFSRRVLAVGDAAGIVKATTGGGIYYSLLSAAMAAETLVEGLRLDRLDAAALAPYESAWRARLGPELKAQLRLRALSRRLTDTDIDDFFHLAQTDGVMPIVRATAKFNRHRELILSLLRHPPARDVLLRRIGGNRRSAPRVFAGQEQVPSSN